MITSSGGGALICKNEVKRRHVLFLATQAREAFPYYQHEEIGFNYSMSNICAGIGRGQMTILDEHINHHKRLHLLYKSLFETVKGITVQDNFSDEIDSNFWLTTIVLDESLHVKGEQEAYTTKINTAIGGAGGMVHVSDKTHSDCEPNRNVEALRCVLQGYNIESRPLWKPMHLQPVYKNAPSYVDGTSEKLFKTGLCLPSGPMVSEEDVAEIVDIIKDSIVC